MLGTAVHHVGVTAHLQLGSSPVDRRQLPPLVHQGYPAGPAEFRPLAQQPYQIPQQGGLSSPRRGEEQGADRPPVLHQLRQDGQGRPLPHPGNPDGQGGDVPDALVDLSAGQRGSAQAHPEAPGGGDISVPYGF